MSTRSMMGSQLSFALDGLSAGQRWLLSIPVVMVSMYFLFSFIGYDWNWFNYAASVEASRFEQAQATNSALGRFFFVLLGVAYAYFAWTKSRLAVASEVVISQGLTEAEIDQVVGRLEDVMEGWADHFGKADLEIDGIYLGHDRAKASESTKKMIQMTLSQVSGELTTALRNELR